MAQDDNEPEIEVPDFPGNSNKDKIVRAESRKVLRGDSDIPAKKKVKRVVKGKIYRKKKSFVETISQTFFGEDTKNVGTYILWDVLIPAAKDTIQEMVASGIQMLLFGESRGPSRSNRRDRERGRSTVSYGSYYRPSSRNENPERRYGRSVRHDVEEIIFERGDEAADVLATLEDMIDNYGQATIADYYDASGYPDSNFTNNKYGWDDLSKTRCIHVRGGYIIDLPRPIELD